MRGKTGRAIFLSTSALLLASAQMSGAQEAPEYAPQGWSEPQRNFWYSTSQGSRLMPLAWMQALEHADGEQLFLAADSINRYRYLPFTTSTGARLPVGFAIDRQDDRKLRRTSLRWLPGQGPAEPWIGLTCSACHTGEIALGSRRLRIDGAPALGHYQRFVVELDQALEATRRDSGKWSRFARRVLGDAARDPANVTRLGQAVDQLIALQGQLRDMNAIPRDYDYGFARVDAFGHIFNKTVFFAAVPGSRPPVGNPSTAPVSYPFLWNVPQHNLVQWNGSVANKAITRRGESLDIGAIGRNTGEVIGVFGEVVTIPRRFPGLGLPRPFASSVNFGNLIQLERMLQRLRPPAWPEGLLGTIDVAARDRGRALFGEHCASCHAPLDRTDLATPIRADMSYLRPNAERRHDGSANIPPDTDPLMACNAYVYEASSGQLAGYRQLRSGRRIADRARVVEMTSVTAINTMAGGLADIALSALEALGGYGDVESGGAARPGAAPGPDPGTAPSRASSYPASLPGEYRRCVQTPWAGSQDRILGYKARPLTGIWATAPYLHNGSVPSLYELLLPPDRRTPSFFLGTRQYDVVNVGYLVERSDENSFEFRTRDERGNIIWGNYNGGHDYGNASLDEGTRRRDLIEYLKSL